MASLREALQARQDEIADYGAAGLYPYQERHYDNGFSGILAENAAQAFQRIQRISRYGSLRGLGRHSLIGNLQDSVARRYKSARTAVSGLLLPTVVETDHGRYDSGWTVAAVSPNRPNLANPNRLHISQLAAPAGTGSFQTNDEMILRLQDNPVSDGSWVDIDGGKDTDRDYMFPIGLTRKIIEMSDEDIAADRR